MPYPDRRTLLLALALCLVGVPALAQGGGEQGLDWLKLIMSSIGGLALFLLGVSEMASGLGCVAGGRVERWLHGATNGPIRGLATGVAATTVLDSSSVTIILLIGLVDSGLLNFAAALPVILGSNIGTTVSSQVFALGVDDYAPVALAGGLLVRAFVKNEKVRGWGQVVAGIGLILFGLNILGDAMEPLKEHPGIVEWLRATETPLRGVLIGAVFTLLIQSSSATLGVVITMAGQGIIDLPTGLAMMLGAEIGTCSDTLIATIGRSRAAVRAGLFHLGFNLITVAVGVALIGPLAALASWTSSETQHQIANAHVAFNVIGALAFLWITPLCARLLERLVPERGDGAKAEKAPA
ncbi:Na/Pi symporter [Pararoseomonas sp. SCSIO 73927]|uniref:Na/Pi cotransporter family protein n=1 Tax=Pararoseomonas sp. SCSIO 73927 TaxID=3114537 RepID=UPI0030D497F2